MCLVVTEPDGLVERCVWCCKEQYCIRTLTTRSTNQGKLDIVTQEMAWLNVNILGINQLKWTGIGEFNSADYYIYYCGYESLRRNGAALVVNKRVWNVVLECNLKNNRRISVHFQGKPFNITVIQVYVPTTSAEEAKADPLCEDLRTTTSRTNTKKRYPFPHRGLE